MLEQKLNDDMKNALKQKDPITVSVIRMLKSDIINIALKQGKVSLDDPAIIKVIQKHIKQHEDSIHQFKAANRNDLVQKEKSELNVLKDYMPKELSDDELCAIIDAAIEEVKAKDIKDMGKVMQVALEKAQGRAFGQRVSEVVKEKLL